MSVITTPSGVERLNRKLEKAGVPYWIGQSSGDAWGKYLVFRKGGRCVSGAGWTLREAAEEVERLIAEHEE